MKLIGEGNTAQIYDYDEGRILKVFRPGLNEYAVKQEYHNSCTVYEILGDIVPKVYGKIEYEKRPGIIYEKIEGEDMIKQLMSNPSMLDAYSRQLAQYHVSIQQHTDKKLPSVKEKLKTDIEAVSELSEVEKKAVLEYLARLPEDDVLCHFDFHPGNIMLKKDRVIVIDWMTACIGDPLADVARTCMMLEYATIPGVEEEISALITKQMLDAYQSEYLKLTGAKIEDITVWRLPIMTGRLREWISEKERKVLIAEIKRLL